MRCKIKIVNSYIKIINNLFWHGFFRNIAIDAALADRYNRAMHLTNRLVLLLALGALPLLFVGYADWLLTVVLIYNALLAACAVADFLASPRPEEALILERTVDDKLSLGAPNPVVIEARNSSGQPLKLTVRDLPPPAFDLIVRRSRPFFCLLIRVRCASPTMSRRRPKEILRLETCMFSIQDAWA